MTSDNERRARRDQGPQGTQVFSREEVSQLIGEASEAESTTSRAELSGLSEGVSGQSFALTSARMVIGRAESCNLRIDDASVSSEHARLSRDAGGWRVVNLLSTNGTFVNEQKVSSAALSDGDRLRFGRVEFRFHNPDEADTAGSSGHPRWMPWLAVAIVLAAAAGLALWLL
ncbi:FHA domain-containing protein [Wenzhouxiangella sp. XN201]|uniref:FHA domain-containing protein n=1 Tax=Wenzhouxiangella sp. XN201 TaxID=2710755 RepID=UPI0013CA802A|nr:FHA domain-containing protein [Wenzhouxiangella sp. XN201]NEZ02999.1 FHA domain-containing protein [Wenzhouxiangella sp. XN201]